MQRITTANRVLDKHGSGKDGFKDGVPVGAKPTRLAGAWFDGVQEELANVIEDRGGTLDGGDLAQASGVLPHPLNANIDGYTPSNPGLENWGPYTSTSWVTLSPRFTVAIANCLVGDVMRISAHVEAWMNDAVGYNGEMRLYMTEDAGGGGEASQVVPTCITAIDSVERNQVAFYALAEVAVAGLFRCNSKAGCWT